MSTTSLLSMSNRRNNNFSGKNDFYGDRFLAPQAVATSNILEALSGVAPFPLAGVMIDQAMRQTSISRLNRYRTSWRFYRGEHWLNPLEDGEKKPVANYCKKIVDVAVDWFIAEGWTCVSDSGNEQVSELLDQCWEYNKRRWITEQLIQYGAICGDSFLYITLETKDVFGNPLPAEEQKVKLIPLNPAYCFPIFNPLRQGEMLGVLIQFPIVMDGMNYSATVTQDGRYLYSIYITEKEWTTYYNGEKQETQPNPFGMINVVHIPNFLLADSVFGQNDIHQITELNEEYNLVLNSLRKIIKYHAEPTTVIYGAKAGDLQKGAKNVWSNLPIDSKIENLMLQASLKETYDYKNELEKSILNLASTPRVAYDSESLSSLARTSGIAMQIMFQPLIDKTRKRRTTFTEGVRQANKIILVGHELLGIDISSLADNLETMRETSVAYTSPLPRDEQAELDAATKKRAIGVWSRAEAVRRLSDVKDLERLTLELAADDRYDLALAFETQRANVGMVPNLSVAFLSSSMLTEDLEDVAKQSQSLEAASIKKNAPPQPAGN